jgi:hypothetical protein
MHGFHRLIFEEMVEVGYNITGVVIGNKGTPACAYTFTPIDQHHGYDWCIPAKLHRFRYSDAVHRRYKTKICKKFGKQPCYVHKQWKEKLQTMWVQ